MNCFTKIPKRKKLIFYFFLARGGGAVEGARVSEFFLLRIQI